MAYESHLSGKPANEEPETREQGQWYQWITDAFGPRYKVHQAWLAEASEHVSNAMGRNMAYSSGTKYALAHGYNTADDVYNT